MVSKPIFKQSIQTNWKLWVIITFVASMILSGFIISYDATGYASIAEAAEGTAFSNILSSMTSLLGSLENFYKLIAVILGIVYVVFTANNLVVNEVDSGSMAYTLSTPIRRSSVIFTKSLYLISSVILMYIVISLVGLGAAQLQYNNVSGYPITDDIKAASETLDQDERYISERLYLIQNDEQALREAAVARDMDTEAYTIYLEDVIYCRSYEAAADVIELTAEELMEDPGGILSNNDALVAGARVLGISVNDYNQFINDEIAEVESGQENNQIGLQENIDNAKLLLQMIIDSSASALSITSEQVGENLTLTKNSQALVASTEVTGLAEEQIIMMVNHAMVSSARSVDDALEFDIEAYFWLSLGLLLLILAMSSIAFFTSTLFNRTGLALAIGGGIPFAFFLMTMIQQLMDSSSALKYFTITTLFDTDEILAHGEFGWGLVALGSIAFVLYAASNVLFTNKDLPL